jgi:hypothetical protein
MSLKNIVGWGREAKAPLALEKIFHYELGVVSP